LLGVSQARLESRYAAVSDTGSETKSNSDRATVFMELTAEENPGSSSTLRWRVTNAVGNGSTYQTYQKYYLSGGLWEGGEGLVQGSYTGPLSLRTDPSMMLQLRDSAGSFGTLGEPPTSWTGRWSGSVSEADPATGKLRVRSFDEVEEWDPFRHPLEQSFINFVAPKEAIPFTGRFDLNQTTDGGRSTSDRTASVQFWPVWNDVEVVVEIVNLANPGVPFSEWRPEGNLTFPDWPGTSPLQVKAILKPKAENPTEEQLAALPEVRRFRFELSNTSREPGVCLNWPVPTGTTIPSEDPEFDLRFVASLPDVMVLSPRKQKAGVNPLPSDNPKLPSAWVQLDCYDFGAHADMRVIAELADGRELVGYLKVGAEKRYQILIPDRTDGSYLARKWREEMKITGRDGADEDDQPTGDGQKGDGFSNYEEYRGFRVGGAHVAPDPQVKDLFVRNRNGGPVGEACRAREVYTAEGSPKGLKIWDGLAESEWHTNRVMNLNRGALSPRSTSEYQHGVLIEPSQANGPAVISYADVIAEPLRPKNVARLAVHRLDNKVVTIAHELAHAIGIEEHGLVDFWALWEVDEVKGPDGKVVRRQFMEQPLTLNSKTGNLIPFGGRYRIHVFMEGQILETITGNSTNHVETGVPIYIAKRGGQHSGNEYCIMRYNSAGAYIPHEDLFDRVLKPPPKKKMIRFPGAYQLCPNCQGTGVNPEKFGNATLGFCRAQLCVRDSAPLKPPATGQCAKIP